MFYILCITYYIFYVIHYTLYYYILYILCGIYLIPKVKELEEMTEALLLTFEALWRDGYVCAFVCV